MNEFEIKAESLYFGEFLKTLLENGYSFSVIPTIDNGELKEVIIRNICAMYCGIDGKLHTTEKKAYRGVRE